MGLEPTTFCMASRRSSQLSYIRGCPEYSRGLDAGSSSRSRRWKGRMPAGGAVNPGTALSRRPAAWGFARLGLDSFRLRSIDADAARLRRAEPRPCDRRALGRRGLGRGRRQRGAGTRSTGLRPRCPARSAIVGGRVARRRRRAGLRRGADAFRGRSTSSSSRSALDSGGMRSGEEGASRTRARRSSPRTSTTSCPALVNVLRVGSRLLKQQGHGTYVQITGGSARRGMPGTRRPGPPRRSPPAGSSRRPRASCASTASTSPCSSSTPRSRARRRKSAWPGSRRSDRPREEDVARAVAYLAAQSPRGWTHELQITPAGDRWVPRRGQAAPLQ